MQIVINIDDKLFEFVQKKLIAIEDILPLTRAVANGVPLPKGHGALKDVSQIEIPMCEDSSYEKWVQVAINSAPTIIEAE